MTNAALKDLLKKWQRLSTAYANRAENSVANAYAERLDECADELSAALSAMEGEAVAGRPSNNAIAVALYSDEVRKLFAGETKQELFAAIEAKAVAIDTAPPPQQAATCHNCGVQCYGWHRCPPATQPQQAGGRPMDGAGLEALIVAMAENYEMYADEGYYMPSDFERTLLVDFAHEVAEAVAPHATTPKQPENDHG